MLTHDRLTIVASTAALAVALQVGPVAHVDTHRAADAAPAVKVVVSCYGNPEHTRITNNKGSAITIKTVGNIYKPYSEEPFTVNRKLGAKKSFSFQSGAKAKGANKLTRKYIYNNDVGDDEGARVKTSVGTFSDRCKD